MVAIEIYEQLHSDIKDTVEIFTIVGDKKQVITVMAWEKIPPIIAYERNVQGHRMIFDADINVLAMLISEHCSIEIPTTNTLPEMIDYLASFQANKEGIIKCFESIIGHPEKRIQHGYDEYTTYEAILLSRMKVINERAKYIQEQFEKLILVIDSEASQ